MPWHSLPRERVVRAVPCLCHPQCPHSAPAVVPPGEEAEIFATAGTQTCVTGCWAGHRVVDALCLLPQGIFLPVRRGHVSPVRNMPCGGAPGAHPGAPPQSGHLSLPKWLVGFAWALVPSSGQMGLGLPTCTWTQGVSPQQLQQPPLHVADELLLPCLLGTARGLPLQGLPLRPLQC